MKPDLPFFARVFAPFFSLVSVAGCADRTPPAPAPLDYEIVATLTHDITASTQGLLFHEGAFYESTGGYGESTLRKTDPATGRVERLRDLPTRAFGEGLALREGQLYQLEWKSGKGFIYDLESFDQVGEFSYASEGWGLAYDGENFILSDGTATLRFLEPERFSVVREVTVRDHRGAVDLLNELEFVEGRLFANRWHHDEVVSIDPKTGWVDGILHLGALQRPRPRDPESVLNGIAYDHGSGLLYVTGKRWPNVYAIRLRDGSEEERLTPRGARAPWYRDRGRGGRGGGRKLADPVFDI